VISKKDVEKLKDSILKDPKRGKHLDILAQSFFDNLERGNCEYGGWGHDDKRPYGNSYVAGDIAEMIGLELCDYETDKDLMEEQERYCNSLYDDLGPYMKYKWDEFNKK